MIIIQMHKGNSLFSRIIQWFSRSHFSHVSFWLYDSQDPHKGEIYEAWEGEGVRKLLASQYQKARNEGKINLFTYKSAPSDAEKEQLRAILAAELGKDYDYRGVLKFLSRRPHNPDEAWFCSEYVAYGSRLIGKTLFERTEDWELKPSDIPRSLLLREVKNEELL
jgi:hypothetical protein